MVLIMERIAILSDVHGNKTALEAVFNDIYSRGISRIFCLGDSVTKCANPDIVIDMIRKNCEVVLKGNCDEAISSPIALERKYWSRVKIGEERASYLYNLPIMHELYFSGHLIRLFHASPFSLSHIYNPMFSNANANYEKAEHFNPLDLFANTPFIGKGPSDPIPDIIGYGHIHTPNIVRFKNKTFFNTGSVGIPIEMENKNNFLDETNRFSTVASYSILEGDFNSKVLSPISISIVRVPYDISYEISDLAKSDMPGREKIIFNLKTASPDY